MCLLVYDSDIDRQSEQVSDHEDIIPRPRRFIHRTILSESDEHEDEWSPIDNSPILEKFLGRSGINVDTVPESITDALDFFIGDDLFTYFGEESNRYHQQKINNFKIPKKSVKWKDITISEMKKFLRLIIFMEQVRKDKRDQYWTADLCRETPFYR